MRALLLVIALAVGAACVLVVRYPTRQTVVTRASKNEVVVAQLPPGRTKAETVPGTRPPSGSAIHEAYALVRLKKFDAALAAFEAHLALNPRDEKVLEAAGRLLARTLGKQEQALAYLRRAVAENPENTRAMSEMLLCYERLKSSDAALREFHFLAERYPDSAGVQEMLGALQAQNANLAMARKYFEAAARRSQTPEIPLMKMAEALRAGSRPQEAIMAYERVLKLYEARVQSSDGDAEREALATEISITQMDLADSLIAASRYEDAQRLLEEIRARDSRAPVDPLLRKIAMFR